MPAVVDRSVDRCLSTRPDDALLMKSYLFISNNNASPGVLTLFVVELLGEEARPGGSTCLK